MEEGGLSPPFFGGCMIDQWDRVSKPDSKYLKKIDFGALKGKSDINPQWRIKK
jgi:hypothetical protein